MFTVYDGRRALKFEGTELSSSSSKNTGQYKKDRWIEFTLYKTKKGHYVLSRVGASNIFHHASCPTVRRNGLDPLPSETLPDTMVPCKNCMPSKSDELIFPEMPRRWAQVSDTADGVIKSLKQYDEGGTEYLTDVAKVLLETASAKDEEIFSAFYTEWIQ